MCIDDFGGVYMNKTIIDYINENLSGEAKQTALDFANFLESKQLTFYKDMCDCWKDKIYYWVKKNDSCVCFVAIMDPDEPDNLWTVWSDDSPFYADASISDEIKNIGWEYVDHCGNCGSCGGGKEKVIFGKTFPRVCGCTFRIDNAKQTDIPFLKTMVEMKIKEICTKEM